MRKKARRARRRSEERLTREEWLARALEVIGREGRGWIGIHDLVELVGVTKGSFYWHFTDRKDFVEALLDYWLKWWTVGVADELSQMKGSAEKRLLLLAEAVMKRNLAKYDLAIEAWARREAVVAETVKKVERFRRDYIKSLFREMGFRGDDLEMRTETFLVYYSQEAGMQTHAGKAKRLRQIKLRHRMLVRK